MLPSTGNLGGLGPWGNRIVDFSTRPRQSLYTSRLPHIGTTLPRKACQIGGERPLRPEMSRVQRYNRCIVASTAIPKMSRYPPNSRPPPRYDPRKPQPLVEVLGRSDAFLALRAGVEQVAALQRDLAELLPDYLGSNVEPGFIKDGVLALFAGHNALAARLRHIEPRLLADLQQRGWPVDALKIRVRPQAMKETVAPKQARMSAAGADALQTLAETLEPSPLQEALAKMAARHHAKAQKK
jgi:hypothetical protein